MHLDDRRNILTSKLGPNDRLHRAGACTEPTYFLFAKASRRSAEKRRGPIGRSAYAFELGPRAKSRIFAN